MKFIFLILLGLQINNVFATDPNLYRIAFDFQIFEFEKKYSESQIESHYQNTFKKLRVLNGGEALPIVVFERFLESWQFIRKSPFHQRPPLENAPNLSDVSDKVQNEILLKWNSKLELIINKKPKDYLNHFLKASDEVESLYWFLNDLFFEGNEKADLPISKMVHLKDPKVSFKDPYPEGTRWMSSKPHHYFQNEKSKCFIKNASKILMNTTLNSTVNSNLPNSSQIVSTKLWKSSDFLIEDSPLSRNLLMSDEDFKIMIEYARKSNFNKKNALNHSIMILTLSQFFKKDLTQDNDFMELIKQGMNESKMSTLLESSVISSFEPAYLNILLYLQDQIAMTLMSKEHRESTLNSLRFIYPLYVEFRKVTLEKNLHVISLLKENFPIPSEDESYEKLSPLWREFLERELQINFEINDQKHKSILSDESRKKILKRLGLPEEDNEMKRLGSLDTEDEKRRLKNAWIGQHPFFKDKEKCIYNHSPDLFLSLKNVN